MSRFRPKLTYSNVVSTIALFVVLGGGAYAANKIGTKQLKNGAVTTPKLKNGAVKTAKLAPNARIPRVVLREGTEFSLGQLGTNTGGAACRSGERAVGGGVRMASFANRSVQASFPTNTPATSNQPTNGSVPTGWRVAIVNSNADGPGTAMPYVVCARR